MMENANALPKEKIKTGGYTWTGKIKLMKDKIVSDVWTMLKTQGFSTLLLVVFAAFLYYTNERQICEYKQLHDEYVKYLKEGREEMLNVINRNTAVMESIK